MACAAALDAFRVATEDIDQQVYLNASWRSLWLDMVPREMYTLNQGVSHSTFAIGEMEPTGLETWAAITLANGSTDACANTWNDVEWGFDETTYAPEKFQLRGPNVCEDDLLFSHDVDTFLAGYIKNLSKRARRSWEQRYEAIHVQLAKKAVADQDYTGTFKSQTALTSMAQADCELSQEILEVTAGYLNEDGASESSDDGGYIEWGENGPMYTLLIGQDQSLRILRQNAELREDYRFGDSNTLLKRLGASRVIGNFRHVINQRPRRYTFSGGTYTYVPPYITAVGGEDATKGTKQIINPSWRTAPYEAADVVNPNLFTSQVVPHKSFNGVPFPPKSYMGEWKFVTGPDSQGEAACDDPLHTKGRHFAKFMHAPKPNPLAKWRWAYHIIFKRCLHSSIECTTCSS